MVLNSKILKIIYFIIISCIIGCGPLRLNNSSDPSARDFLFTQFLRSLAINSFTYSAPKLVGETGILNSGVSSPSRADLFVCSPDSSLPSGWSLSANGTVTGDGTPSATHAPIERKITCFLASGEKARGTISFEVKGIDWVKNLSASGSASFSTGIYDIAAFTAKEIYFVGVIVNNSSDLGIDFGKTVTKQSYPNSASSSSPMVFKLDDQGNLLSTRVLAGKLGSFSPRMEVDGDGNQYILSSFDSNTTINTDPEFGGSAVSKTAAIPGGANFLLSRLNYDGSFQFARTMSASTLTEGTSLCYSKANQKLYVGGRVNGAPTDLGLDFGSTDSAGTASGFILELTTAAGYVISRKLSGSTHIVKDIICLSDGAYSFATNQVANILDYRTSYGGVDSLTGSGGSAITRIASGNSYQFTKLISSTPTTTTSGMAVDAEGNMVILFKATAGTMDLRAGVDGGTDTKTSAGGNDLYVVKVSKAGAYLWGKRIGGTAGDEGYSIQIKQSDGNVFVLGTYNGISQQIYSDLGSNLSFTTSNVAPFLVELAKDTGNFVRNIPIGVSSQFLLFNIMKFDSEENLYLGGEFRADTTFRYSPEGKSITKSFTYPAAQGTFVKIRP